jgi:hypothetical protein
MVDVDTYDDDGDAVVRRRPPDKFGNNPPPPFLRPFDRFDQRLRRQINANENIFVQDTHMVIGEPCGPRSRGFHPFEFCCGLDDGETFLPTHDRYFATGVDLREWVNSTADFRLADRDAWRKISARRGSDLSVGAKWPFLCVAYNDGKPDAARLSLLVPLKGSFTKGEHRNIWNWLHGLLSAIAPGGVLDDYAFEKKIAAGLFGNRRRCALHVGNLRRGGAVILDTTIEAQEAILDGDGPTLAELWRLLER